MERLKTLFTTENGVTSTSANYICNIAKEYLDSIHKKIESIKLYNESLCLLDTDSKKQLSIGITDLEQIQNDIKTIASINALVTYLRKAIAIKEDVINDIENYVIEKYNIVYPKSHFEKKALKEEDIIKEFSLEETIEYDFLTAHAAHYGKMIHPKQPISIARDKFNDIINNPNIIKGEGHDAIIIERTPSLSQEEVESFFMELLNKQRDYEKRLNHIKFEIKERLTKRNIEIANENKLDVHRYLTEYDLVHNEFKRLVEVERSEISKLKIIIPEKFKNTFDFLNSLGK